MSTDGILKHAADVLAERSKTYGEALRRPAQATGEPP